MEFQVKTNRVKKFDILVLQMFKFLLNRWQFRISRWRALALFCKSICVVATHLSSISQKSLMKYLQTVKVASPVMSISPWLPPACLAVHTISSFPAQLLCELLSVRDFLGLVCSVPATLRLSRPRFLFHTVFKVSSALSFWPMPTGFV